MADVHNKAQRRRNMRAIKSKNTSIEVQVRKMLWHAGYRYRLNVKDLPGTPDIYLPKYRLVIQVNGCFWHGHKCARFSLPNTRTSSWKAKLLSNIHRDMDNIDRLRAAHIRVLIVWGCALSGPSRLDEQYLLLLLERGVFSSSGLGIVDKSGLKFTDKKSYSTVLHPMIRPA